MKQEDVTNQEQHSDTPEMPTNFPWVVSTFFAIAGLTAIYIRFPYGQINPVKLTEEEKARLLDMNLAYGIVPLTVLLLVGWSLSSSAWRLYVNARLRLSKRK